MDVFTEFFKALESLWLDSGFAQLAWQNYVMMGVACFLIYLAIRKQYEPLLLLPIAFGMLLVNLYPAIMGAPSTELIECSAYEAAHQGQVINYAVTTMNGVSYYNVPTYRHHHERRVVL